MICGYKWSPKSLHNPHTLSNSSNNVTDTSQWCSGRSKSAYSPAWQILCARPSCHIVIYNIQYIQPSMHQGDYFSTYPRLRKTASPIIYRYLDDHKDVGARVKYWWLSRIIWYNRKKPDCPIILACYLISGIDRCSSTGQQAVVMHADTAYYSVIAIDHSDL